MVEVDKFPSYDLLPKEITQALAFVRKNPEYDGRGTVIAILDTGVDVGAPGLEKTSNGKQKIIEAIDCTGSGDVPLQIVPENKINVKDDAISITGCTGKTLLLNKEWINPSGQWKIGMKSLYDLFPKSLLSRIKDERKEKFEKKHHRLIANVENDINNWEINHPNKDKLTENEIMEKEDLSNRLAVLKELYKNYDEPGMILDCVVFNDGNEWKAVIDIDGSGDLRNSIVLSNYNVKYQYLKFGNDDQLSFSINIYDEGETLSIVTVAGSHGTHVAAIASAYYPDKQEQNGVAPGAQIVSLKIGDTRLGSMETGAGLTRAAIFLSQLKCDLANMSYGEGTSKANIGSFIELIRDKVVNETGTVFVSSAGNNGPALTTSGSPGGTTEGVFSVGAYVSSGMMEAEYSLLEKVPERPYTWSSRGPTNDGDVGVTVYAPGGAITSVPPYTLASSQLMNGTSMSSPNCCGCLALIISALKANNIQYTPYRISKAIQRTSKNINDPMNVGLIQVENAFNDLVNFKDDKSQDILFKVEISEFDNGRGIYIRDIVNANKINQYSVNVKPTFMKTEDKILNQQRLEYENKIALISTVGWVKCPKYLLLNNGGRSFSIQVNPTSLDSGFHYAEILAYNTESEANPLFKIPITVIKPENKLDDNSLNYSYSNLKFGPGDIKRIFLNTPKEANMIEVILKSNSRDTNARFILHSIQLLKQKCYKTYENEIAFGLNATSLDESQKQNFTKCYPVVPNTVIELCLAQFWSSLGESVVSMEVHFHSILVNNIPYGDILIKESDFINNIEISAPLRKEIINVSCSLNTLSRSIKPSDELITAMKSRDILPDSKQILQLVLTYEFKISESTNVTVRFPSLNDYIYDAAHEGLFIIIYDSNKKVVGYRDIFAKSLKLSKGEYTVKLQILSKSVELLERIKNMTMVVDQTLPKGKEVNVTFFRDIINALNNKNSGFGNKVLANNEHRPLFVIPGNGTYTRPKDLTQESYLSGVLKLPSFKLEKTLFRIVYSIGPEKKIKEKSLISKDTPGDTDNTTNTDDRNSLKEAIRDLQISYLKKLKGEELTALLAVLEVDYPNHIPLMLEKINIINNRINELLKSFDKSSDYDKSKKIIDEIIDNSKELIDQTNKLEEAIDTKELSSYYGLKHQKIINETEKKLKADNDKKKDYLVQALNMKCEAYNNLIFMTQLKIVKDENNEDEIEYLKQLITESNKVMNDYFAWSEHTDYKYIMAYSKKERLVGRYGNALKTLNKYINDTPIGDLNKSNIGNVNEACKLRLSILNELHWDCWCDYEEVQKFLRSPSDYALLN
jgi:tripeptidyl-peptidase-2